MFGITVNIYPCTTIVLLLVNAKHCGASLRKRKAVTVVVMHA